jgi:hypothetical protein
MSPSGLLQVLPIVVKGNAIPTPQEPLCIFHVLI